MEDEVILLKIQVDQPDVKKEVEAARAQLARLKAEEAAVKDERKKGIITAKEYGESMKAIAGHVGRTNKAIQEGEAILSDYAKVEAEAAKGLTQMKNSLAILTPAQQAHAKSTKEVKERIAELAAEFNAEEAAIKATVTSMDKLDDAINSLDDAYRGLSQAQREDAEVGGKVLAMRNQLIAQQEKNQRVIDNSRKGLKEYIRDVNVLGVNVGSTVDSFKSGAEGVQLFAKGMSVARIAAIALAAVPIVLLFSALYLVVTKTQKGMDFLAQAMSGITSVFTSVTRGVVGAIEAFANSKTKLADLGNFIEQNLINRFKALGVIMDAVRKGDWTGAANGVVQLATGAKNAATSMKSAYDAGVDLAKMNQQIEESEIKLNTERAKSEKIIERQKQIAEDATKTIGERRKAEQAAIAESVKIQKSEEAVQQLRIKAAKAELVADKNNREYKKKVAEEVAKLDEIEKNRVGERTELINQLNAINAEGAAKAIEDAKKVAAEQVAIAETALIQAKKKGEDTIEIEDEILKRTLTLIQARADAEIAGVEKGKGALAQKKLIQAKADLEAIEAARQVASRMAEITYNAKLAEINSTLAFVRKGTQAELDLRIETIEANRVREQSGLLQQEKQLKDSFARRELTLDQFNKANTDLQIQIGNVANNAARAISDAKLEYARQSVSQEADLAAQRLQVELDLGDQSIANERQIAAKRIDLEEDTQKKLLDLELQYNQIGRDEYLTRLNTIQAKALAARKELNKQIADADRANEIAILDARLEIVREGSKQELDLQLDKLKKQRAAAIEAARGDKEAIKAINEQYDGLEKKAIDKRKKSVQEQIIDVANQSTATWGTIIDAQTARQTSALDEQYQALLSSAALSAEGRERIEREYQKKKEANEKSAAEKRRKLASAENLINTAVSVTKAFATAGPIVGAILAALALAKGIAQQQIIDNAKFAVGGVYRSDRRGAYVTGPGSGTSDSINARISNGEAIINAQSTRENYDLLSAINSSKGYGRPFPKRSTQPPVFDITYAVPKPLTPAFALGGVNLPGNSSGIDQRQLSATIQNSVYSAMREGFKDVKIYTAITDVRHADKKYTDAIAQGVV